MWAYCYRRLASDDVADAVGEVYLTVWRKIDRAPIGDEALPWMYGVARNVVRNLYRSTSRLSRLHQKVATVRHESPETPETQIVRYERDDYGTSLDDNPLNGTLPMRFFWRLTCFDLIMKGSDVILQCLRS
jgi:RNA polymerase sigma-70 factor (ECF subfamily)